MAKHKSKGFKLPKRIAGVKVPKHLRKSGGSLGSLLESPMARQILADALVAAAGALAANRGTRQAVSHAGSGAAETVRDAAGAIAGVVAEGMRHAITDGDRERQGRGRNREAPSH
ncbi:hypothetical protein [Azospirillum sp. ST 5-10]|uniref:hypothetical protein n=1 Tax=unclassified Azospirillum TaxID=2630922 RepID=UPI003F4A04EA